MLEYTSYCILIVVFTDYLCTQSKTDHPMKIVTYLHDIFVITISRIAVIAGIIHQLSEFHLNSSNNTNIDLKKNSKLYIYHESRLCN